MASSGGFVVLLLLSLHAVALLASASEPLNPEGNAAPPTSVRLRLSAGLIFRRLILFPRRLGRELSPRAVQALIAIRQGLVDPRGVLGNWDQDSVDPCSWAMITCSAQNLVIGL